MNLSASPRASLPAAGQLPVALLAAALTIFLLYSLTFLYFFVDDEGIAFVFAKNLLAGRGFIYNSFEGRVEGYSNFLHVLLSSVSLASLRAAGIDRVGVFFVGKAVSMVAGAATIWLAFDMMRRLEMVRFGGAAAGLAFLALAGPLAMWSCSSLEAAAVGALTAALVAALLRASPRADRAAMVAAGLLILWRIDGFVQVGAVLASFLLFDSRRRCRLLTIVAAPAAGVFVVYHLWRRAYFGEWLTAPLHAKVLHKLMGSAGAVVHEPARAYGLAFLDTFWLPAALAALVAIVLSTWRCREARPLLLSAGLIAAYASTVGDWMVGFRFFVPVLPLLAVLIGMAVSRIARPMVRALAVFLLTAWFAWSAQGYATRYDPLEYRENWWTNPSLRPERFFGPYYGLLAALEGRVAPGTRTAFNQAGFVPFMLDLDNIDDVGLCSLFVAKLPTTDVIFTEVGRYSPLTNQSALRTANAYVLYRQPEFVIARMDILRSANGGTVPGEILAGRYRLVFLDPRQHHAVYGRTAAPVTAFQQNPRTFLENLAHTSRLRRAVWNDEPVAPEDYLARLAFLAGGATEVMVEQRVQLSLSFSRTDVPMYELHINQLRSSHPATLILTFGTNTQSRAHQLVEEIAANAPRDLRLEFPEGLLASRLTIDLINHGGSAARVRLNDLRVQGQTPELATYVRQLRFSPQ